jgi:hypothetical protein
MAMCCAPPKLGLQAQTGKIEEGQLVVADVEEQVRRALAVAVPAVGTLAHSSLKVT